ncbi:MAG: TonB C-terminal domain-containing protein [Methyloglobulus sp.]|nr:energy transducer TonB [Methyloglobulus sp.]
MTQKKHFRVYLPSILGALILLVVVGVIAYFISNIKDKPEKKERKIQAVSLSKPPPPPPPPPKVEKPPEPEQQVEKEPELEPEPEEIPDVADETPPGDLGLDAEGTAGSDGFGLAARKGGKGLFGGGGNPFAWYGNIVKNDIMDILSDEDDLRRKGYSAVVKLWVEPDGRIKRFELARGSNDPDIDNLLAKLIGKYSKINEPPPPGMEQPIKLKISSSL